MENFTPLPPLQGGRWNMGRNDGTQQKNPVHCGGVLFWQSAVCRYFATGLPTVCGLV